MLVCMCLTEIKGRQIIHSKPEFRPKEKKNYGGLEVQTDIHILHVKCFVTCVLLFKKKALRNFYMYIF